MPGLASILKDKRNQLLEESYENMLEERKTIANLLSDIDQSLSSHPPQERTYRRHHEFTPATEQTFNQLNVVLNRCESNIQWLRDNITSLGEAGISESDALNLTLALAKLLSFVDNESTPNETSNSESHLFTEASHALDRLERNALASEVHGLREQNRTLRRQLSIERCHIGAAIHAHRIALEAADAFLPMVLQYIDNHPLAGEPISLGDGAESSHLTPRVIRALLDNGISTYRQLMCLRSCNLFRLRGIGDVSVKQIRQEIERLNLPNLLKATKTYYNPYGGYYFDLYRTGRGEARISYEHSPYQEQPLLQFAGWRLPLISSFEIGEPTEVAIESISTYRNHLIVGAAPLVSKLERAQRLSRISQPVTESACIDDERYDFLAIYSLEKLNELASQATANSESLNLGQLPPPEGGSL